MKLFCTGKKSWFMSIICTDNSKNQEKSHKTGLKIRVGFISKMKKSIISWSLNKPVGLGGFL